ncbi:MAG: hypothetical protein DBY37_09665 [Desulfovibrionaceae bacterium]|nr:MAG: hypothetical protein DBY37_09665 [Desulfovibrionaceae bacterium]
MPLKCPPLCPSCLLESVRLIVLRTAAAGELPRQPDMEARRSFGLFDSGGLSKRTWAGVSHVAVCFC